MISGGAASLLDQMTGQAGPGDAPSAWCEQGVVTATSPLTVSWRGGLYAAARLTSYTPSTGHRVLLLIQPPSPPVILGQIVGS